MLELLKIMLHFSEAARVLKSLALSVPGILDLVDLIFESLKDFAF